MLSLSVFFSFLINPKFCLYATESDTIKIAPIGDSLTSEEDGYRRYLYQMLNQLMIPFDFVGVKQDKEDKFQYDTDHSGLPGYTIGPGPSLLDKYDKWKQGNILYHLYKGYCILSSDPDVILLMIGINDFFNNLDTARYNPNVVGAERLDNLIYHIYRILPEVSILVSNITPLRGSPRFAEIFNSEVESIVLKYQKQGHVCRLIDMRER